MKNLLENFKTLIVELIGLVGGFIWARQTSWDYEPLILMGISAVGIVIFIILRLVPTHEDRPIVEMEFVFKGGFRSPPDIIANMSPKDETGQYFIIEQGGTYLFKVGQHYDFVIRNNSKNNAYSLVLYKLKDSFPLNFKTSQNPLEPLTIAKPKTIDITYQVFRPMTHQDAEEILNSALPDDLRDIIIMAEYQSESRRKYYTKFTPLNNNEHLTKFADAKNFAKI